MFKHLRLYLACMLAAVFISFTFGALLYFFLEKYLSIYIILLLVSCCSALLVTNAICKRFANYLLAFANKVDNISIGTAEISYSLDKLEKKISVQAQLSSDSADVIKQVSTNSERLSAISEATVEAAAGTRIESKKGQQDIQTIISGIEEANEVAKRTSLSVEMLLFTSRKIEAVTDLVQGISAATNILSLNAAIQAAHAGEQGKGFAVIAMEIRKLSAQTSEAIKEISNTLLEIQTGTKESADTVHQLTGKINGIVEASALISKALEGINSIATTSEQQTSEMASSLGEYVETTNQVSGNVLLVKNNLVEIAEQSKLASEQSLALTNLTEDIHAALFKFGVKENRHEQVRRVAEKVSKQLEQLFESAIANGQLTEEEIFDQNYQPIANTNPQQYFTQYDDFTDAQLPSLQEPALDTLEGLIFVIATDVNGYVPTHNNKFSHAQTGNYELDLAKSRTKRIFADRVGKRCGNHTDTFLLQTYKRDTGEVMHDLSVPVFVRGKHWGGLRVGYLAGFEDSIVA
jgi:methyl-accepting chemotaxis protein